MKYKMIACDLDGTLIGSDSRISERNLAAIAELDRLGIPFVPCTGRSLSEAKELMENPHIRYIIYSSGAVVLDKQTGERINNGLTCEIKKKLLDLLSDYDIFPFIHANGECYAVEDMKGRAGEFGLNSTLCYILDNIALGIEDFGREFLKMDVEYVSVFFKSDAEHRKCRDILQSAEGIVTAEPWPRNMEIFSKSAGKDNGIKNLADKLGIDVDEVISIGDSDNDISALKVAGLGVAVSNCSEAVRRIAHEIACSNDGHVAEYVLKRYFM